MWVWLPCLEECTFGWDFAGKTKGCLPSLVLKGKEKKTAAGSCICSCLLATEAVLQITAADLLN